MFMFIADNYDFTVGGLPPHPASRVEDVIPVLTSVDDVGFDEFPFYWPDLGYETGRRRLEDDRTICTTERWGYWSTPL